MSARILVVDDLLPNIKLLEAKLNSEYYDVITARSGAEALAIVKSSPPDIILLDVMMPEMDGFETCRRLKADPDAAHIPVVMVTALSEVEDRVQGLKAGADDFLTKPINDLALFARIRSLVRLKIMTDELRLRDQTGVQFGISNNEDVINDTEGAIVLIIDDDMAQAANISATLTSANNTIEILPDPHQAIDKLLSKDFDLIIISTQLNDTDGLRICSHIRSQEKLRNIPILMLVEEDETHLLVKGLDMGVNDYLITPIDNNEVVARVNTQVRRKRFQDALKSSYQKSVSMAITDSLSGLYNRRYFDAHYQTLFDQAQLTGKPLTLMMIDIDHFKLVNDSFGHIVGDEIIKQVSQRVLHNVRVTDLVARYGGEEFVIMLPDTYLVEARDVAERIRNSMASTPFTISAGEGTLPKTISIGMATLQKGDSPEELLKRSDKALYVAKEGGRNRTEFAE
jgi:two-component system, cell cycle response regulator